MTDEVLKNRLHMAHELKLLTDSSYCMSSRETEELRLHIKVVWLSLQFFNTRMIDVR